MLRKKHLFGLLKFFILSIKFRRKTTHFVNEIEMALNNDLNINRCLKLIEAVSEGKSKRNPSGLSICFRSYQYS